MVLRIGGLRVPIYPGAPSSAALAAAAEESRKGRDRVAAPTLKPHNATEGPPPALSCSKIHFSGHDFELMAGSSLR